jgi:4-methylaminobutanoate oxidase (formaldehyde-forming)
MDMSFMGKFLVQGRDAERALGQLCCNDIAVPPGRIVYTQWANGAGGIEADLTVTRLSTERFMVICSDTAHGHVDMWMHRHISDEQHVFVTDVTSAYAQLNLHGPNARALLAALTTTDVTDEAFPVFARTAD